MYAKPLNAVVSTAKKLLLSVSAVALTLSMCPAQAHATKLTDAQEELNRLSEVVEKAQDKYNAAQDAITSANAKISRLQKKIERIESKVQPYRDQLAVIAKWEYTTGSSDMIATLISGDTDFADVLDQLAYVEKVKESKIETIKAISEGEAELEQAQAEQRETIEKARAAKKKQKKLIADTKPAIKSMEKKIEGLREEQKEFLLGKGLSGGGPALPVPKAGTVVDYALSRVGCPYVWGAAGPESFDCSGLVMWAYAKVGKKLPHNSEAMRAAAKAVVPLSEAQPGDVLYRPGHVGLCTKAGAKEYVHAPHSGAYVRINDNNSYSRFTCALRF